MDADVIVIGAGLAGLVATAELADAGRRVLLLDQESEHNLGGQAYWSFGGLFLVDSPEQRRMGIRDSAELAWQDWLGSAGFDRDEDHWPRRWAREYVHFAAGEKRAWLRGMGLRPFAVVGWADGGRCTRPRRRPDAGHHRSRRRPDRQPGPHVALHRGSPELGPDLAQPRHPDPARPVVALARRHRTAPARPAVPRLRHPRHVAALAGYRL